MKKRFAELLFEIESFPGITGRDGLDHCAFDEIRYTAWVRPASTLEVRPANTLELRPASTLAGETLSAAPGTRCHCLGEVTHSSRS